MDIVRAPYARGQGEWLKVGTAGLALSAMTLGLSGLRAATPTVDRATVWIDRESRGILVAKVARPTG